MSLLSSEAIKKLQQDYMKSFPEKWVLMSDAFEKQSWTILERELHKFAGSGTTYKMPEISKLAKAIELYLERTNPPNIEVVWEGLEIFRQILEGRQKDKPLEISEHEIFKKLAK